METPKLPRLRSLPGEVAPRIDSDQELIRYWEGIAAALQVSVKTAQRYEKQYGLPVRRKRGSKGAVIYALRSELNAWLASNPGECPADSAIPTAQTQPSPRSGRRWLAAAGGLLVAVALLVWWFLVSPDFSSLELWQLGQGQLGVSGGEASNQGIHFCNVYYAGESQRPAVGLPTCWQQEFWGAKAMLRPSPPCGKNISSID